MTKCLFTSESVTEGHPDKVCDQISDTILDTILAEDPQARVACETACAKGQILIMGEITSNFKPDYENIARSVVNEIGYNSIEETGFDANTCKIITSIQTQSPDIALGVDKSFEQKEGKEDKYNLHGAGDQGMMFGYACNETEELMPLAISLSNKLAKQLTKVRKDGTLPYLRPDGKTQVTVEYDEKGKPVRINTVVVSSQHSADVDLAVIQKDIIRYVIKPIIPEELLDDDTIIYVNPTGRFVSGGPAADSGLTGRKIIVDSYGGTARHGGGAFSGKDPTKVDRSAAYAARYVAKNIVASGLAEKCEIQIAYAIGVAKPVSIMVETFGTGKLPDEELARLVAEVFDLRPAAIIEHLNLRRPIYKQLAAYGHFGRHDLDLPWEKTDKIQALIDASGIDHLQAH